MSQTIGPVTTQKGPVCFAGGVGPVYGPGTQSFVLDLLSSYPTVAFSVRHLTANPLYVRPYCMLVRRSSDNATLNIGYVNGLLDIVSLLAFCGSGNGYVVTWYNQGSLGSSGDATQSTAASQPQVCASGVVTTKNGVPAIRFTGTNVALNSYKFAAPSTNFCASIIASSDSLSTADVLGNDGAGAAINGLFGQLDTNSLWAFSRNAVVQSVTAGNPTANTLCINRIVHTSANAATAFFNGVAGSQVTGLNWTAGANSNFTLGYYSNATAFSLIGYESEVIYWLTNIGPADAATYDLNAAQFYGITGVTQ